MTDMVSDDTVGAHTAGAHTAGRDVFARLERHGRRGYVWVASDQGAVWAWRLALLAAVPIYYFVGRHQWFNRDDWAYVLTREQMRASHGWDEWLFVPQDGHWLSASILVFKGTMDVFGLGSYWPFLLLALISHTIAVVFARLVCRRVGVSEWTTTLLAVLLLFFGSGWHNLTFAIQVCYSLSVLCFLGQLLLVDHDGPVDRRDVLGALIGLVTVSSSGFGPIFMAGVAVLLVLRRRWVALAVGVGPQALAYAWWTLAWNLESESAVPPGVRTDVPAFVKSGVTGTFEAMVGFPAMAGVAIVVTVATMFGGPAWRSRRVTLALGATVVVMFAGIGWQRVGLGVASADSSRYRDVAALVVAPAFGLAVDRARRLGPEFLTVARLGLLVAVALNLGLLRSASQTFAAASRYEQRVFGLVLGSDQLGTLDAQHIPVPNSPDVNVWELPLLAAEGAITPRQPVDAAEQATLDAALSTGAPTAPMPPP